MPVLWARESASWEDAQRPQPLLACSRFTEKEREAEVKGAWEKSKD